MLFVVDTSFLIVLNKLDWLDDVIHYEDTFLCPPKVVQELKNNKKLLKWLNNSFVVVTRIESSISITEISKTDAEVISLAVERGGCILSEDKELGQKADMKITISMSKDLITELDELTNQNGRSNRSRLIQKLLRESIIREKQARIAQLYVKGGKTLRQCAELLGIELEEMIDLLRKLDIPLDGGGSPQNKMALKIARQIRDQKIRNSEY